MATKKRMRKYRKPIERKPNKFVKPSQKNLVVLVTKARTIATTKNVQEMKKPKGKRANRAKIEDEPKNRKRRKYIAPIELDEKKI